MPTGLFIDSSPERAAVLYMRLPEKSREEVVWAKTVDEAREHLKVANGLRFIFLEHDLDGHSNPKSEFSGMEIVRYLEKANSDEYKNCTIVLHSWREDMADRMMKRLTRAGYKVQVTPFGM